MKEFFAKNLGNVDLERLRMENWVLFEDAPGYSISSEGRVRNDKRGTFVTPTLNSGGVLMVKFHCEGERFTRGLAKLVAETFVPNTSTHRVPFDRVIHLDGDALNSRADNLMWRPMWFAQQYTQQFRTEWKEYGPIRDRATGREFETPWQAVTEFGLLYSDLIASIRHNTYIFPTNQRFEWVD